MIKHYDDGNVFACDECGEDCDVLYRSHDDPDVHLCEKCLKADFQAMAEDWMVENCLDDDDLEEMLRDEAEQAYYDHLDYLEDLRRWERENE